MAAILPVAVYLHLVANAMMLAIIGVRRYDCAEGHYGCEREKCFLHHGTFERNGGWASYQGHITIHCNDGLAACRNHHVKS
jgi:hypothetical protein